MCKIYIRLLSLISLDMWAQASLCWASFQCGFQNISPSFDWRAKFMCWTFESDFTQYVNTNRFVLSTFPCNVVTKHKSAKFMYLTFESDCTQYVSRSRSSLCRVPPFHLQNISKALVRDLKTKLSEVLNWEVVSFFIKAGCKSLQLNFLLAETIL